MVYMRWFIQIFTVLTWTFWHQRWGASHAFNLFTVCISLCSAKMMDRGKWAGYSVTSRNKRRHGDMSHIAIVSILQQGKWCRISAVNKFIRSTQFLFLLSISSCRIQSTELIDCKARLTRRLTDQFCFACLVKGQAKFRFLQININCTEQNGLSS